MKAGSFTPKARGMVLLPIPWLLSPGATQAQDTVQLHTAPPTVAALMAQVRAGQAIWLGPFL